jgi:hypothetical protein
MTLRRQLGALVAVLFAPALAQAATYTTDNFTVDAPTAELAKQFGDMAEFYRKEKALEWLGREMPAWNRRCPLTVQLTQGGAGGATTFTFGSSGGRSVVSSQQMEIRGDKKQMLYSVLPHEVTHTVLAHHFGRPVPRWADEGGSVLSENDDERFTHDVRCRELLNAGRGIRLRVLFRMTEYPKDIMVLYAQGFSVSQYLVKKGGDGREGRARLLQFLGSGMAGNTIETWNSAAKSVYGFDTVDAMEEAWLEALKTPPARVAARDNNPGSLASARTELRTIGGPGAPLLEPPVGIVRGTAPDREPVRPPVSSGARPTIPDRPPPLLLPPELPVKK